METCAKTTTLLLQELLDPDNEAVWREFVTRYRPIVLRFIQRFGVLEHDAEEIAQEAIARFVRFYREGKYDRDQARLRTWLIAITRNCFYDWSRTRARRKEIHGDSILAMIEDDSRLSHIWDAEHARVRQQRALQELRRETRVDERTIRAFEMVMLDEQRPADVARALNISVDSVYAAKHRCLSHLRTISERLDRLYDCPEEQAT